MLDGYGEWRGPDGTEYAEPTKVVIHLAAPEDHAGTELAVQAVIDEAKRRSATFVLWRKR